MTTQTAVMSAAEQDVRWREWTIRGAASDRRAAQRMRIVMMLIVATLLVWSYLKLA